MVSQQTLGCKSQFQKQLSIGVSRKRCSENMQKIYRRTPNFIEMRLRHGCSPVNLLLIFGTLIYIYIYISWKNLKVSWKHSENWHSEKFCKISCKAPVPYSFWIFVPVSSLQLKEETPAQVLSCDFCEICWNIFFIEHLWATASEHLWAK